MDPFLRRQMYKKEKLKPFDTFFRENMKMLKIANTPTTGTPPSEDYKTFKVGMKVLVNFQPYSLVRGKKCFWKAPRNNSSLKFQVTIQNVA